MKAMLITAVAATFAVGTVVPGQDLTQDTKKAADNAADATKDTTQGCRARHQEGSVKTGDVTKDTIKDVAHGTTKAAKKTGHAVGTGAKDTGKAVKTGADKTR